MHRNIARARRASGWHLNRCCAGDNTSDKRYGRKTHIRHGKLIGVDDILDGDVKEPTDGGSRAGIPVNEGAAAVLENRCWTKFLMPKSSLGLPTWTGTLICRSKTCRLLK